MSIQKLIPITEFQADIYLPAFKREWPGADSSVFPDYLESYGLRLDWDLREPTTEDAELPSPR